jgi:hypothetical protein
MAGKKVSTVKAGTYKFTVSDRSKKTGLVVGHGLKKITLSGASAVGTGSHTIKLTAGKWFVVATPGGAKIYFTVK